MVKEINQFKLIAWLQYHKKNKIKKCNRFCLVKSVKTIPLWSQLPRHYKGSHAYSKVWRTNKTITLVLLFRAPSTFIVMSNFHRFKVLHKCWRWLRDSYLPKMPTSTTNHLQSRTRTQQRFQTLLFVNLGNAFETQ